jgi:hypothetical protein
MWMIHVLFPRVRSANSEIILVFRYPLLLVSPAADWKGVVFLFIIRSSSSRFWCPSKQPNGLALDLHFDKKHDGRQRKDRQEGGHHAHVAPVRVDKIESTSKIGVWRMLKQLSRTRLEYTIFDELTQS